MFYDVFLSLCDVYETSPAEVRKALGISQSTMASWKSRGLTPNSGMLVRLSDYFGVSVEYLLGLEDMNKKPYDTYGTFVSHKKDNDEKREKQLLAAFNLLNLTGQNEAIKRVEELTEIPKYQRQTTKNEEEALSPPSKKDTAQSD